MDYLKLNAGEIAEKLICHANNKDRMLILCHKNPDGDAVGSAFALKMIYASLGGSAVCLAPSEAPGNLKWMLDGQNTIVPDIKDGDYDFVCAVDVASPVQLGINSKYIDSVVFMIDHHGKGEPFADNLIDSIASATGELIFDVYSYIIKKIEKPLSSDICRRIYGAISSDTGSFRFGNTTEKTMETAAKLLGIINKSTDGGMTTAEISRILHETVSKNQLFAEKTAIEALNMSADGRLAYVMFTSEMMEKNGLCELDLGKLIDVPRSIEGVDIAVSIKQSTADKSTFFVSSRSNCEISVSEICAIFGGGGHDKAAGATIKADSPEAAMETVIPAFEKALK